jgi:acyl carrier protein
MSIEERLARFISKELLLDEVAGTVSFDYRLLESGLLDSLGIQELTSFIEDEFGVRVLNEDLVPENFVTIESLARMVQHKRTQKTTGTDTVSSPDITASQ